MRYQGRFSLALLSLSSAVALLATPCAAQSAASSRAKTGQAALDDPTIVAIFDAANTADIETGRLAAERGHDAKVRDFGAMIARDHQNVRQQGRDLAKRLQVTPTPPKPDEGAKAHAEAMQTLKNAKGADFDAQFLRHEVAFHQQVIDALQHTLLPAIKNAELKALVEKVAPAFQAHLIAAQQLEKQLGISESSTTAHAKGSRP